MVDPYQKLRRPEAQGTLSMALRPLWYGHLAVASFIVLSGFCLQWAAFKRSEEGDTTQVGEFFKRRCRRILPPYYACLVASLVVCYCVTQHQKGMPWEQYVPVSSGALLSHVFMVHNLSAGWMYRINGVLWSIAIEFQLYFTFPWLALAIRKRGWIALLIGLSVLTAVLTLLPVSLKLYPWYAVLFGVGIWAARFARSERSLPGLSAIALVLFASAIGSLHLSRLLVFPDMLWGTGVAFMLVSILRGGLTPVKSFLGCKPVATVGMFSYSLYLIHHPILQVITVIRPSSIPLLGWLVCAGIPAILLCAFGFFWLFERPFLRSR